MSTDICATAFYTACTLSNSISIFQCKKSFISASADAKIHWFLQTQLEAELIQQIDAISVAMGKMKEEAMAKLEYHKVGSIGDPIFIIMPI